MPRLKCVQLCLHSANTSSWCRTQTQWQLYLYLLTEMEWEDKDSELNGKKHSPNLICSALLRYCKANGWYPTVLQGNWSDLRNIGQGEAQHRKYKSLKLGDAGVKPIKCLDCCHILGQYTSLRHNLLYKTWADRSGVYTDTLYLECIKEEEEEDGVDERKIKTKMFIKQLKMYICIFC